MQDRIATYPGRVRLTPVTGETDVYDLERADEPIQSGTPINKATLLTDAAAAAVETAAGENSPPSLPSQALGMLAAAISELNGKAVQMETGGYTGTGTYGSANPCTLTFSFQPSVVILGELVDTGAETHNVPMIYKWGEAALQVRIERRATSAYNYDYLVNTASVAGKTLSWYAPTGTYAYNQANISGKKYFYIAFAPV